MINYDSILSAFDGKPTLLQWLKMVKKALDESVLKDVTIEKDGDNIAFTFNFEDGTSVTTPKVTLPKGDKGDKGNTGATGPKGNDGVSITGIDTVSDSVVGDKTLTTLRANYSDNTSGEFVVTAKNGKDGSSGGGGKLYLHKLDITNGSNISLYNLYAISNNNIPLSLNSTNSEIDDISNKMVNYGNASIESGGYSPWVVSLRKSNDSIIASITYSKTFGSIVPTVNELTATRITDNVTEL